MLLKMKLILILILIRSSNSDMSMDNEFDEDDVEDSSGPSDDDKQDPDYEPLEFRLNSKVASMARVDVTRKMTIQNLAGDDTVVTFRPEKHGEGYKYVANGWCTNFTKPNGINAPSSTILMQLS
ncbi:hypothetical protein HanXRQr2_Chr16g0737061 [Helianthus annuus]|uniref:Uncharacterized protein n=1 Tax=Helianthus annuus TaxID=4232 RepID=A0A9K3DRG1_HELAN|nr:hypothetical protein HanXRQr2_Chr16g0737061 [Helianthus annuus]KAJ0437334.1 hypothetical protein HanHA300_Chr16g0600891 [Helianthus annuus]KAJ0459649.1 hypothetical protein HanHA89_Chr16g0651391 [Helianthus annuus]